MPHSGRMVVVEVAGKIFTFADDQQADQRDLLIDLQKDIEGHRRTYGIAFHPNFEKNRYVYLCYVTKERDPQGTHVSRFRVEASDPPHIDPKSEKSIIRWYTGGHNGGCLKLSMEDSDLGHVVIDGHAMLLRGLNQLDNFIDNSSRAIREAKTAMQQY